MNQPSHRQINLAKRLMLLFSSISFLCCQTYRPVNAGIFKTYKSHYLTSAEIKVIHSDCFELKKDCDKAATDFSLISDYAATLSTWDLKGFSSYVQAADTLLSPENYQVIPCRNYLDTVSNHCQVIMINEAHHRPECRILTADVARLLQPKGFKYLGVEGLKETGAELASRGFPSLNSGIYIREPQYSNLLRVAMKMGYEVFDYDNKPGRGKQREINQAFEINAILQKDPGGRILIHAGWGHIREDTSVLGGLMAYEFKKLSGIDPVTINQVRYMPMSKPEYENPFYKRLHTVNSPAVLLEKNGNGLFHDPVVDAVFFHPNAGLSYFLENDYHRRKIRLNIKDDGILLAIPAADNLEKLPVPVFTKEVKKARQTVLVDLPFAGRFNLYLLTAKNLFFIKKIVAE